MIRWGILGLGNIAIKFAEAIQEVDNANLVAIGSLTKNKLNTFGKKFNISEKYRFFAATLFYEENPELLPKSIYNEIHQEFARRLLSTNDEKFETVGKFYKELDDHRNRFDKQNNTEGLQLLDEQNLTGTSEAYHPNSHPFSKSKINSNKKEYETWKP